MPSAGVTAQTTAVSAHAAPAGRLSFWDELKRRKVYNVGLVYLVFAAAAAGWISDALDNFHLEHLETPIHVALLIGFPLALVLAWSFEVSREGVRRTGTYEVAIRQGRRWPLVSRRAVVAVLVIGGLYVAFEIVRRVLLSPS